MKKAIIGKKIGMTQIFDENGKVVPVTVLEAGPCTVTQIKTEENDGYASVQFGFGFVKENKVNKPMKGHFDKSEVEAKRYLREFRFDNIQDFNLGDEIKVDVFESGEKIDVTGVSKGKGFQGVIKRHGQSRGPMAHGSKYHRRPGSMGASSNPSRVFKGKKLPGRMGGVQTTVQNLEVVKVDAERNILLVRGAVPGPKGGLLIVKNAVKA